MILRAVERGNGGDLPLVLLHGLFGRAQNFGTVQARLASSRRVVALDLRGHGGSPHATPIDYPTMAADVAETLRAVGAWPCALVGHSMGGKVAMTLALTQPASVARLIAADVAPVTYESHFGGIARAMLALPLAPGLTRAAVDAALAPSMPDVAIRRFLAQNFLPGETPGWTFDLAGITAALPAIESWPDFSATFAGPTLFLAGDRSDYVTEAAWPLVRRLFPGAQLQKLPAGHWLHAEDPDGFVSAVDGFLRTGG